MQGYSHALTGASAWLLLANDQRLPLPEKLPLLGGQTIPLGIGVVDSPLALTIALTLLCAGAALAPDMDHHSGTIAYSLPPLTRLLCRGIAHASGGHRHGTHSLLGVVFFTLVAWAASAITAEIHGRTVALGAGVVAVLLIAFAVKGLGIRPGRSGSILNGTLGPWIISLSTAGAATYFLDYRWETLPIAVGVGALVHNLGDMLTTQGVPWLWPLNPSNPVARAPVLGSIVGLLWQDNGYIRIPVLGDTTSLREGLFSGLVGLHVLASLAMLVAAM